MLDEYVIPSPPVWRGENPVPEQKAGFAEENPRVS